ncbi:unnamed protein product [Urochloa humidicola]
MSGDTEIVPSSGNETQSQHLSIAKTEKISSSSPDLSNSGLSSQGNKRRFSDTMTDAIANSVAGRTRARRNSMSPSVPSSEIKIVDNPEGILRKNRTKRLVTRKRKSPLCSSEEVFDVDAVLESSKEDVAVQETQCEHSDDIVKERLNKLKRDVNKKLKERLLGRPNVMTHATTRSLTYIPMDSGAGVNTCHASSTDVGGSKPDPSATKISCEQAEASIPAHAHDGTLHKIRQLLSQVLDQGSDHVAAPDASSMPVPRTPIEVRSANSVSFDHLLTADISSHRSRHLDIPSVNTRAVVSSTIPKEESTGIGPSSCIKIFNSKVTAAEKMILWDFHAPSFSLGIDFDDDVDCIGVTHNNKPLPILQEVCRPSTTSGSGARHTTSPPNHSSSAKSVMYMNEVKSRHNNHITSGSSGVRGFCSSESKIDDEVKELRPDNIHGGPIKFDATPTPDSNSIREVTPELIPLIVINSQGKVALNKPPESPEVLISGQRFVETKEPPEVTIIGGSNFKTMCNKMAEEATCMYNDGQRSCFAKCQSINFQFGSTAKGQHPRRSRCILKPNSYYRNFQINACTPNVHFLVHEKLAYDCLMFYSSLPQLAKKNVINYGNVCVTYDELCLSLQRSDKTGVHIHVMNAFCRKLFKDRHPSRSSKHYFFSTVGEYLIGKKEKHDNCHKCFDFANKCFNFLQSDFLFFPILHNGHWFLFIVAIRDGYFIFLDPVYEEDDHYQEQARTIIIPNFVRAWDEFIGYDCDFEEFVIHYAPVPKQDRKFWSKYDDGIFVMKYLEMWDPYVNMMVQFSSSNINDIRVKLANEMVFSKHNKMNDAKQLLNNFDAMVKLKNSTLKVGSFTVS